MLKPIQEKAVCILREYYGITRSEFLHLMGVGKKDQNLLPAFQTDDLFLPIYGDIEEDKKIHLYLDEELLKRRYGDV